MPLHISEMQLTTLGAEVRETVLLCSSNTSFMQHHAVSSTPSMFNLKLFTVYFHKFEVSIQRLL
jgi:hypothetical protein